MTSEAKRSSLIAVTIMVGLLPTRFLKLGSYQTSLLPSGLVPKILPLEVGEQLFSCFRILHGDGSYRAVFGGFQHLLQGVALGVNRLRLAVLVEPEDPGSEGLAHGVADTDVVVHRYSNLSSHGCLLHPRKLAGT